MPSLRSSLWPAGVSTAWDGRSGLVSLSEVQQHFAWLGYSSLSQSTAGGYLQVPFQLLPRASPAFFFLGGAKWAAVRSQENGAIVLHRLHTFV